MRIELERYIKSHISIRGHLYLDGRWVCETIETSAMAIPAGRYELALRKGQSSPYSLYTVPLYVEITHGDGIRDCRDDNIILLSRTSYARILRLTSMQIDPVEFIITDST